MKRFLLGFLVLGLLCGQAEAATCYVSEFQQAGSAGVQVAVEPPIADQAVAVPGNSVNFNKNTKLIRINCDVVVSFLVGSPSPSAGTSNARLPTGVVEYFQVPTGATNQISFVTNN